MDKVFLYLFGAGASSQVLPLAADFAKRMDLFVDYLKSVGPPMTTITIGDLSWGKDRDNLLAAIEWLANESSHHFSVDTFAKKLFFRGDYQNLKKLKAALSAYLVIEQSKYRVDKRYDAFFASVLQLDSNRRLRLPKQLRMLTWNYDLQLEKAFYGFCKDYDMVTEHITFNENIYRINGLCGTHPPGHIGESFRAVFNTTDAGNWEAGVNLYKEYMAKATAPEADINFAWEDRTSTKLKNVGLNKLGEVTDLVVVGYSFPYFNREIDDLIFRQLGNLFRVYLQFPDGEHAAIEERIKRLLPEQAHTIPVHGTDLFFVPNDF